MNRAEALRVLGVADDAAPPEILAAFARLSAHLEARGARASSPAEQRAHSDQIASLRLALGLRPPAQRKPFDTRIAVALAIAGAVAVVLIAGWGMLPLGSTPAEPPAPVPVAEIPAEPPQPARLGVLANVPGAEARISTPDGGALGAMPADGSPIEIAIEDGASETEVRVSVSHPECRVGFEGVAVLSPGEELTLEAVVCPKTGWLVVRSNETRDTLLVDGTSLGATGIQRHPVRAGRRKVAVTKPGFVEWSTTARVQAGSVVTLRARLERTPESVADQETDPGGSRGWHEAVSSSMVQRYDLDLSGLIDTEDEVAAVPCSEWQGLEQSYETGGLSIPMTRLYGFDGSRWVKDALGIDLRMRDGSYTRMRECGLR